MYSSIAPALYFVICRSTVLRIVEHRRVDRVSALGREVLMPPTDNGWLTNALVRDSTGNHLSLIAASPVSDAG